MHPCSCVPQRNQLRSTAENIGRTYFRAFKYQDWYYALAMPGLFYRSKDGFTNFETGPLCFNEDMRHSAVLVEGDTLKVYWTQVGQTPERIPLSTVDLSKDWSEWRDSEPREILTRVRLGRCQRAARTSIRSTATGTLTSFGTRRSTRGQYIFTLCGGWRKWHCNRKALNGPHGVSGWISRVNHPGSYRTVFLTDYAKRSSAAMTISLRTA